MRSLLVPQVLCKALLAVMLLCSALPLSAQAQSKSPPKAQAKTKAKAKPKPKAKKKTPAQLKAEEEARAAEKAKAEEEAKAAAKAKAEEEAKAAARSQEEDEARKEERAKAKARAEEQAKAEARARERRKAEEQEKAAQEKAKAEELARAKAQERLWAPMRIGLGLDLFTEDSRLTGRQTINSASSDESFNYSSASLLSATLSVSFPAPVVPHRARVGGGVRVFGNYGAGGDRQFGFGVLNQLFASAEYGVPLADRMEALFGARGGVALLIPGREFSQEIDRLQEQGVSVWSVPRVGWFGGLSVGARRRMGDHLLLRADLSGQLEQLYLFYTGQEINGLEFDKDWSTFGLRMGLTLGVEFAL
jgi:hypothetical protein